MDDLARKRMKYADDAIADLLGIGGNIDRTLPVDKKKHQEIKNAINLFASLLTQTNLATALLTLQGRLSGDSLPLPLIIHEWLVKTNPVSKAQIRADNALSLGRALLETDAQTLSIFTLGAWALTTDLKIAVSLYSVKEG